MRFLGTFFIGTLSILVAAAPAGAQALTYGGKAGLDLTSVRFGSSFAVDTGTSAGIVGGGFLTWTLAGRFAVRGEVLVSQERAVFEGIITDTIRTLDVPVLVRYRAASVRGRAIDVSGGVVARRVLAATESAGGESSSIKDGVATSDLALTVGASVGLLPHWTADTRYLQGRKGLYKKIGGGTEGKTRTVQITVEYAF
jgi:hypothetical protein